MKTKRIIAVLASISTLALSGMPAFAAAWNVPSNVRVVQKSNTDTTGRIYSSIQSAINSITNASATNPYVVIVMPGIYDLGTTTLQMKEYVTLEGKGDSSVITSAAETAPQSITTMCDGGTVKMANNSALRNIKVINRGGTVNDAAGVSFTNVTGTLEGVTVIAEAGADTGSERNAVCAEGAQSNVSIDNSKLASYSISGESAPIEMVHDAKVVVTNSKLSANTVGGWLYGIDCNHDEDGQFVNGEFTMINCMLDLTNNATGNDQKAYYGKACKNTNISNSIVIAHGDAMFLPLDTDKDTTIVNTQYHVKDNTNVPPVTALTWDSSLGKTLKISNSLITGGNNGIFSNLTNVKLFGNVDENLNPIPNQ